MLQNECGSWAQQEAQAPYPPQWAPTVRLLGEDLQLALEPSERCPTYKFRLLWPVCLYLTGHSRGLSILPQGPLGLPHTEVLPPAQLCRPLYSLLSVG